MNELALKFEQLNFASNKLTDLKKKLEDSPNGPVSDITNEEKWKYYTGFRYNFVNSNIFPIVEEYVPVTSTTALSSFNQLLLTLIKLRLNTHFKDLNTTLRLPQQPGQGILIILLTFFIPD